MSFEAVVDLVTRAGATGALLVGIWAFLTERIVPGTTHRRVQEERDEYRRLWADAVRLAGRATTVADKALTGTGREQGSRLQAQRSVRSQDWEEDR